jgi:hypothetical protein
LESANIASKTTPAITKKNTPEELFFFSGVLEDDCAALLATLEAEVENELLDEAPRVGTGGITSFETSTVFALRFAVFLAGRFELRADFLAVRFTARFAGRLAAARFAGRFFAADFFFDAT